MSRPLLVDTDVMVDYLRGREKAVRFLKRHAERIVLSSITVAELYAGVKGRTERAMLDEVVSLFPVIPVTAEAAKAAGLLKRDFGKSHGVGLADAMIAATVQAENAELKTLNVRHYPMLRGLKPAYASR